jgi:hypothetical protein
MHIIAKPALAGLMLAMSGALALAQEAAGLQELRACRLDEQRVALSFKYEGSPCWQTLQPTVEVEGYNATITVPTEATAEVCTMQIVVTDFAAAIEVEPAVMSVTVDVTSPEGSQVGTGLTDIAATGPDCVEPAPAPAG